MFCWGYEARTCAGSLLPWPLSFRARQFGLASWPTNGRSLIYILKHDAECECTFTVRYEITEGVPQTKHVYARQDRPKIHHHDAECE